MYRDLVAQGLAAGVILLLSAGQAPAGPTSTCLARADMVAQLAAQYGETRHAIGLAGPTRVVELFASAETGTWTIIVTTPAGKACMLAAGDHFERFEAPPPGDPA
jgi:hypothetical protein